jgi:hypothetical protein
MSDTPKSVKKEKPKPTPVDLGQGIDALQCHDEVGRKEYPVLSKLFYPQYVDGVLTRQRARIGVREDDGVIRVSLTLPTEKRETFWETDSLYGLWEGLEAFLSSGKAKWKKQWTPGKKDLPTIDDLVQ